MRLTLRILGLELIDLDVSTDEPEDEPVESSKPETFGFHASGTGVIERCDDTMLDSIQGD